MNKRISNNNAMYKSLLILLIFTIVSCDKQNKKSEVNELTKTNVEHVVQTKDNEVQDNNNYEIPILGKNPNLRKMIDLKGKELKLATECIKALEEDKVNLQDLEIFNKNESGNNNPQEFFVITMRFTHRNRFDEDYDISKTCKFTIPTYIMIEPVDNREFNLPKIY